MSETGSEQTLLAEMLTEPDVGPVDLLKIKTVARQDADERKAAAQIEREFDEKHAPALGKAAVLRRAILAWLRRDRDGARSILESARKAPEAAFLLGHLDIEAGDLDAALARFEKAAAELSDPVPARVARVDLLCRLHRVADAKAELKHLKKAGEDDPAACYARGRVAEAEGRLEEALDAFDAALQIDPDHAQSLFRTAVIFDLRGEDDRAFAFYERCGGDAGTFVGALINTGLIHDDRDEYQEAMACFQQALTLEPNNARARLYYKNAEGSLDMYYDEAQRKEQERMEQVLRTPITDFEFSVRSRNCLAKMNIKTLGDLIERTEAEMLGYKNFGETSLREIKEVLQSRNLRLGMRRDEEDGQTSGERLGSIVLSAGSEVLMRPIVELELGIRSRKAMSQLDIQTFGDLVMHTESELITVKNFGQTSLNEVKQKLAEFNLVLKPMDA